MMRQIADHAAPYRSIDDALTAGHVKMRDLGWSPVGLIVEMQKGGYFVRISGTTEIGRGGRKGRKRVQHHSAEVGRISHAD